MNAWKSVIFVLGGLGLFLYGMSIMSMACRKPDRMRRILEALTGKVWKGVLVGTLVTAVIQSSSAATVMLVLRQRRLDDVRRL